MPGPANALNIAQQGVTYFDGVSIFSGLDGSTVGKILTSNGTGIAPSFQTSAPSGDVVGPASALNNDIVVFNGITGKIIKDTGISSIAPTFSGNVTSLTQVIAPYDNKAGAAEGFFFSDGTVAARQVGTALANYFFGNAGNSTMSSIANTGVGQAALVGLTSGLQNTGMGNGALLSVTSGQGNSGFGYLSGQGITNGVYNTAIGLGSLSSSAGANYNNAVGALALQVCTGNFNNAVGYTTLQNTTGSENTAIGHASAYLLTSGSNNTILGSSCGQAYTSTESNNILIGQGVTGIVAESNAIHLGGSQTTCYIAGIKSVVVANQQAVMINSSTGQLGAQNGSPAVVIKGVNVNLKNLGATTLFTTTAPFVVLDIIAYGVSLSGVIGSPIASAGWTAASYDDVSTTVSNFATTQGNVYPRNFVNFRPQYPAIPTATAFRLNVTTVDATATTNTQRIDVRGYYL